MIHNGTKNKIIAPIIRISVNSHSSQGNPFQWEHKSSIEAMSGKTFLHMNHNVKFFFQQITYKKTAQEVQRSAIFNI